MAVGIELIPGVITIFLAIIGMGLTGFHRLDKRTGKRIAIDNRDADKLIGGVVLYVAGVGCGCCGGLGRCCRYYQTSNI